MLLNKYSKEDNLLSARNGIKSKWDPKYQKGKYQLNFVPRCVGLENIKQDLENIKQDYVFTVSTTVLAMEDFSVRQFTYAYEINAYESTQRLILALASLHQFTVGFISILILLVNGILGVILILS